jgi:hypothetical protein
VKIYIVYDDAGEEQIMIRARSHNEAEEKAKVMYGEKASVSYTEI